MPGNRIAAENVIYTYIEKILPGSENVSIYKSLFKAMNDKQFSEFMGKLEDGTSRLAIVAPNFGKYKLTVERNLDLAVEIGHEFFERIWIDDGNDIPPYLSPVKYLIVDLPLRRQAQLLVKKISIPEDNKSVDDFTGQPTGKSKGSTMSYPEIQILASLKLDESLVEMIKYRGGDTKAFDGMNNAISKTGGVSLASIEQLGTTVKSTTTLNVILTAMHIANSLGK